MSAKIICLLLTLIVITLVQASEDERGPYRLNFTKKEYLKFFKKQFKLYSDSVDIKYDNV